MVQISSIADVWFEDTGIKQNVFVAQNVYDVVPYNFQTHIHSLEIE